MTVRCFVAALAVVLFSLIAPATVLSGSILTKRKLAKLPRARVL